MVELTIEQLMHLLNSALKEGAQGAPDFTEMDVSIFVESVNNRRNEKEEE